MLFYGWQYRWSLFCEREKSSARIRLFCTDLETVYSGHSTNIGFTDSYCIAYCIPCTIKYIIHIGTRPYSLNNGIFFWLWRFTIKEWCMGLGRVLPTKCLSLFRCIMWDLSGYTLSAINHREKRYTWFYG